MTGSLRGPSKKLFNEGKNYYITEEIAWEYANKAVESGRYKVTDYGKDDNGYYIVTEIKEG